LTDAVLVAYATRYGSTQEVAAAVAEALREKGLEVDLQPAREVRALDRYRAVVLGAPFYMFRWHKDAMRFLSRHREALLKRPVAIFALGPTNLEDFEKPEVSGQLDKALSQYPWLKPAAVVMFGGKWDSAKLTFPYNLIPALKQMPVSDIRDWEAIRAWASELAAKI
jgi:menaquinone-dependent protoporphyrinogen oxidase